VFTFLLISRLILLRVRNVSGNFVEEIKINIFFFKNIFYVNRAVYEITWKIILQPDKETGDSIIRPMRFACRINKSRIDTDI